MEHGQKVKTHPTNRNWRGAIVSSNSKHLFENRREGTGTVLGWVPGYGGDLWYVAHGANATDQCVYLINEMEKI